MTKHCVNCVHCEELKGHNGFYNCRRPSGKIDIVTGKPELRNAECYKERGIYSDSICGIDGQYYQEKPSTVIQKIKRILGLDGK